MTDVKTKTKTIIDDLSHIDLSNASKELVSENLNFDDSSDNGRTVIIDAGSPSFVLTPCFTRILLVLCSAISIFLAYELYKIPSTHIILLNFLIFLFGLFFSLVSLFFTICTILALSDRDFNLSSRGDSYYSHFKTLLMDNALRKDAENELIVFKLNESIFYNVKEMLLRHYKQEALKNNFIHEEDFSSESIKDFLLKKGLIVKIEFSDNKVFKKLKLYEDFKSLNKTTYMFLDNLNIILDDSGLSREIFDNVSKNDLCVRSDLKSSKKINMVFEFLLKMKVFNCIYDESMEDHVVTFGPRYKWYREHYDKLSRT